jgi:predicted dehydrogenase
MYLIEDAKMKKLPYVALIGCGAIAESYYLPALARHPEFLENIFLVDRDLSRTKQLAEVYRIKHYLTDYRDVLQQVDGAIVALPTHLHYPVSLELLSQGKHVLCEKPLAESKEKAMELMEQARRSSVCLAVNYLQRLIPTFVKVKQLLADRVFGEPLSIQYVVGEEFRWPTVTGFYFNAPNSCRGILRDRGAHVIDHICWWLGGKPSVISSKNDSFGGSETVAQVEFKLGRCRGEVLLNWLVNIPCKFKVVCERGSIEGDVYDYQNLKVIPIVGGENRLFLKSKEKNKVDIGEKVVTNFIGAIARGDKPLVSGIDVLDSISFIDECYQAATSFDMPWYDNPEVAGV